MIDHREIPRRNVEISVTEFPSPRKDALAYPGRRPESSYLTDGNSISPVSLELQDGKFEFFVDTNEGKKSLNSYLKEKKVDPMEERIPVVGFGSNGNPEQLKMKFEVPGRDDLQIVPVIYGTMNGVDAVYGGRASYFGYYFAELVRTEETKDTEVNVVVTFLTRQQLALMHKSEPNYVLAQLKAERVSLGEDIAIPALLYAGVSNVWAEDGVEGKELIALEDIKAEGRVYEALNEEQMMQRAIDELGLNTALKKWLESSGYDKLNPDRLAELLIEHKKDVRDVIEVATKEKKKQSKISVSEQEGVDIKNQAISDVPTFGEMISEITNLGREYLFKEIARSRFKDSESRLPRELVMQIIQHFRAVRDRSLGKGDRVGL